MRLTIPVAKVLSALLADPDTDRYGLDLMNETGLASGTLYPILQRLQQSDWVAASWEEIDPVAEGRPARRYYRLTAQGATSARQALAELHAATVPGKTAGQRKTRPAW
jgi:DNA-binding PadR family transcriptional regulator